jgi:hypothetical protein
MTTLRDYAPVMAALPYDLLVLIRDRLRLSHDAFMEEPYSALLAAGYCAADAVVVLSSSPDPRAVVAMEALLGRPIRCSPPGEQTLPSWRYVSWASSAEVVDRVAEELQNFFSSSGRETAREERRTASKIDARRVAVVLPLETRKRTRDDHSGRLAGTPSAARYALLRPGMRVDQWLLRVGRGRGLRDLLKWQRSGEVRLS